MGKITFVSAPNGARQKNLKQARVASLTLPTGRQVTSLFFILLFASEKLVPVIGSN
jgi:hypothetical protein